MFIDADKDNYVNYFQKIMDGGLLNKGGFIAADNVTFKAAPWAPDACYDYGPVLDTFNRAVRYIGANFVHAMIDANGPLGSTRRWTS